MIPNEKLASDTIRNSTIRSRKKVAEVTVQVPLDTDLDAVSTRCVRLRDERRGLRARPGGQATVQVSVWAPDEPSAERLERELRLRAHERLRAAGVFA